MSTSPIVFRTTHRVRFSELDPYQHVSTGEYARYFVDHRMMGVRDHLGWDMKTLAALPFKLFTRRMEIEFVRAAQADQEITITSYVREFRDTDAHVTCTMHDANGKLLSRSLMIVAHVDGSTLRATPWPDDVKALFFESEPDRLAG
jgi:acyl-CoA thioester hydrolase